MTDRLECFIDGNCLCVVKKGFVNLQEDDAVFVSLSSREKTEIDLLLKED